MEPIFILLDGAQGLIVIPLFLILHIVTTIFIEGGVLKYYGYGTSSRCVSHALIANFASLIVGLVILMSGALNFLDRPVAEKGGLYHFYVLIPFFIETIIVEGFVLWVLVHFPIKKLILATLVMNLLSYITLWLVLTYVQIDA